MSVKYTAAVPQGSQKKPRSLSFYIVVVFAFAVGITPEFEFLGIPKVRYTDLLLPLIAIGSAVSGSKTKRFPFQGIFIALFTWNLGCLLVWGSAKLTPGIFYLAKRFEFFLIAYLVSRTVRDQKSWNQVVRTMIFASPLLSFTVLHELNANINSGTILSSGEYMRASGIIANQQSSTAAYIAVATCIALSSFNSFKDPLWKVACAVSLGTGFAAILATGSRGGLVAMMVSLLATSVQKPRQAAGLFAMFAVFGSLAWSFTPADLQTRFMNLLPETRVTLGDLTSSADPVESEFSREAASEDEQFRAVGASSVYDRIRAASFAVNVLIPQAGLVGLGAGYKQLGTIDNFYLMEWISHGLVGFALWGYFQGAVTVGCWRISKQSKDPAESGFAAGATSAMIVMGVLGFQGDSFYLIRPSEALALILGLVVARKEMQIEDSPRHNTVGRWRSPAQHAAVRLEPGSQRP